jgi:hypothetical protein
MINREQCPICKGKGEYTCIICHGSGALYGGADCFYCKGKNLRCVMCEGTGYVSPESEAEAELLKEAKGGEELEA